MTKVSLLALGLAAGLAACSSSDAPADLGGPGASTAGSTAGPVTDDDDERDAAVAPPDAVAAAFARDYPSATARWEMEDGAYEAEFVLAGVETSVLYASDGTAGAVETTLAEADLPAPVRAAIARDHAGQRVTEAARLVDGSQTRYEAEITTDGVATDYVYAADGTLVETTAAESD